MKDPKEELDPTNGKDLKEDSKEEEIDPDADYLGNIWGWKFSFIGLGIILFFLLFAIIRSQMLGVPLTPTQDIEILDTNNPHLDKNN